MEQDMMKRNIVWIVEFLIFNCLLFSVDFSLDISPYISVSKSEAKEILYTESTDEKLSELLWKENPIIKLGFNAATKINSLNFSINFSLGIPNKFGEMTDSDWNLSGTKTIYSIHEEEVTKNISAGFDFFYDFNFLNSLLTLSPGFYLDYNYVFFEGRNGYGWYGNAEYSKTGKDEAWNSGYARKAKKVAGIDYERNSFSTYLLLFSKVSVKKFTAKLGFYISPFSYYDVLDHHYSANSEDDGQYFNYIFNTFFTHLKIDMNLDYRFNKLLKANFYGIFEKQFLDYGPMYFNHYSISDQQGGIEFFNISASLGLTISIIDK